MLHWTKLSVMLIPFEIVSISTVKMCIKTCLFPSKRWKPQVTWNLDHAGFLYRLHVKPKGPAHLFILANCSNIYHSSLQTSNKDFLRNKHSQTTLGNKISSSSTFPWNLF